MRAGYVQDEILRFHVHSKREVENVLVKIALYKIALRSSKVVLNCGQLKRNCVGERYNGLVVFPFAHAHLTLLKMRPRGRLRLVLLLLVHECVRFIHSRITQRGGIRRMARKQQYRIRPLREKTTEESFRHEEIMAKLAILQYVSA